MSSVAYSNLQWRKATDILIGDVYWYNYGSMLLTEVLLKAIVQWYSLFRILFCRDDENTDYNVI